MHRVEEPTAAAPPARLLRRRNTAWIGLIVVIVGIVLMIVWSFWIGLIVALVGLLAFAGFVRGRY